MGRFRRAIGVTIAVIVLMGGCADDGRSGSPFGDSAGGSEPTDRTGVTTTTVDPDPTITSPVTDPLADPDALVAYDLASVTPSQDARSDELGGPLDRTTTRAFAEELEAALGGELVGMDVSVWPVSGSDESILVLDTTDEVEALVSDESAGENMFGVIGGSSVLDAAGVTRVVLTYTSPAAEEITFIVEMSDLRMSLETGENITDRAVVYVPGGAP